MDPLEDAFEKAVQNGVFPGAVLLAKDRSGKLNYSKVFGRRSLAEGSEEPLKLNTIMTLASMTKLMTSIAAMQVVERGLISLDDDVSHLIPELANQGVLTGFDDAGKPNVEPRKNPIKLRHLLTHSAGAGYDAFYPDLMKYRAWQGKPLNTGLTIPERFGYPLTYEPGTSWQYGTGLDWTGKVIEELTGLTLEDYMKKNIWEPLSISGITFWPNKNPDMMKNFAGQSQRDSKTGKLKEMANMFLVDGTKDCMGGGNAFGDLTDYIKIVYSLLMDDEVLLKKGSTAQMFKPQLTKESKAALNATLRIPEIAAVFIGGFPTEIQYDWGIGGILVEGELEGRRKKGTLIWSGMPNLFWFIDPEAGLCGVFGTQVFPPGDLKVAEMIKLFELEMNKQVGKSKL